MSEKKNAGIVLKAAGAGRDWPSNSNNVREIQTILWSVVTRGSSMGLLRELQELQLSCDLCQTSVNLGRRIVRFKYFT